MASLIYEGDKLVAVNGDGEVVKEFESLGQLRLAQLPKVRSRKELKKQKPRLRWYKNSFFTEQQEIDEGYQKTENIA